MPSRVVRTLSLISVYKADKVANQTEIFVMPRFVESVVVQIPLERFLRIFVSTEIFMCYPPTKRQLSLGNIAVPIRANVRYILLKYHTKFTNTYTSLIITYNTCQLSV